jgi:hypothetical protein
MIIIDSPSKCYENNKNDGDRRSVEKAAATKEI